MNNILRIISNLNLKSLSWALEYSKVGAIDLHYERSLDLDTEFDLKLANLLNK